MAMIKRWHTNRRIKGSVGTLVWGVYTAGVGTPGGGVSTLFAHIKAGTKGTDRH